MDLLNREQLNDLMAHQDGTCLSLYLSTHLPGTDAQQDRVRLKNLLRRAEEQLEQSSIEGDRAESLLEPIRTMVQDPVFVAQPASGLVVFSSPLASRRFSLPQSFPEKVVLGHHFYLRPLLPLLSRTTPFFVLALSLNRVRLLEATQAGARRVELPNAPSSLAESTRQVEAEHAGGYQVHSAGSKRMSNRTLAFHGHGGPGDDDNRRDEVLHFFRQVGRSVGPHLSGASAPLILAAVDSHLPVFRTANPSLEILGEHLSGNPEPMSDQELQGAAWELLKPRFRAAQLEDVRRFRELKESGRTSVGLEDILTAARGGRIEVLMIAEDEERWGSFDPESGEVEEHAEPEPADQELLNLAASFTLQQGGTVDSLSSREMPDYTSAAAIFRY